LATFKLTISDKQGKSITRELKEHDANPLIGLKVGSETDAAIIGMSGKLKITGGSDRSGVPMRGDIHGGSRKYVLLSKGIGLQDAEAGQRVRKLVRGNIISEEIYQINCKFDGIIKSDINSEGNSATDAAKEKNDIPKKEEKDKPTKKDEKKE
jgi:small subunit ribosomal protein S6e